MISCKVKLYRGGHQGISSFNLMVINNLNLSAETNNRVCFMKYRVSVDRHTHGGCANSETVFSKFNVRSVCL